MNDVLVRYESDGGEELWSPEDIETDTWLHRIADLIDPQPDKENFKPYDAFDDIQDWFSRNIGGFDK